MARPIATRWRWPPESWAGLLAQKAPDAEDRGDLVRRRGCRARLSPQLHAKGEVLEDGHVRIERVALEDHREVALLGGPRFCGLPSIDTVP